jgi:SAM-dependent methyltransferase
MNLVKNVRAGIRRLQEIFQTRKTSFALHNAQYEQKDKLEKERQGIQEMLQKKTYDESSNKISRLLARYPNRELCIDIGSGNGWYSAYMSQFFKRVEGIEPSAAGISIAKQLHPKEKYPNIVWHQGFAESVLKEILIDRTPVLLITGCVLSHLRDKEVMDICNVVNNMAKVGSALSWSEGWGKEYHRYMWHIRTKEWWQKRLSNWELDFHGGEIENIPGRHKGFHGIKIRS